MASTEIILVLDVLALCAAIAMAIQAFNAHRLLGTRTSFAFLACFSLISLGLLSQGVTDFLADITFFSGGFFVGLSTLALTPRLLLLVGVLCILTGYTILLLVVENVNKVSMWMLVFLLVLFTIFLAADIFLLSHILAIVLLALLAYRFYMNFLRKGGMNSLAVYAAFLILLAAHVAALFVPISYAAHIIFLVLRLVGYFSLFAVSWRISHG